MHFTGLHGEQADKTVYPSVFQPCFLMFWYKDKKIFLIFFYFIFLQEWTREDFLAQINRRYYLMSKWRELYICIKNKKIVHMHAFKMKSIYFIYIVFNNIKLCSFGFMLGVIDLLENTFVRLLVFCRHHQDFLQDLPVFCWICFTVCLTSLLGPQRDICHYHAAQWG